MSQGASENNLERGTLIAMGSNEVMHFGGAQATIKAAMAALERAGLVIMAKSRLFSTPCFPAGNGPDFVNAALHVRTKLPPDQLLEVLHQVEAAYGRKRAERWGARSLDLDLIAQGCAVLPDRACVQHWIDLPLAQQHKLAPDRLILPHPRLQDRGFVLIPLAEIAPDWRHPLLGKTVTEMLNQLPEAEKTAITPLE